MVNLGVSGIDELLQHYVTIGRRLGQIPGGSNGTSHPQLAFRQHQLGPIGREQLAALQAHRFRHGQGQGQASGGSHKGQGDACVATGGLNQFFSRSE